MRAAFYSYPSAFQNPGGGEVQLIKTGEYLRKAGVEVKLFDQWKDKLEDFDILHVFGSVKDCTGLMAAARNRGVKVVLSPIFWSGLKRALREEGDILKKTGLLVRHAVKRVFPYFPSGRRETMELSDIMLPNSIMEAEQITKLFGISRRKMAVVPNGVDLRFREADAAEFIERYGKKDFILYAGRIEPRKNQLNFIRAMKGTGRTVVFAGEPVSDYTDYYEQCRKEASENTFFIGRVEHESTLLSSAYAASGIFALTSWFETPGLAALEAGLSGSKVVITEEGSTREYFGDMAFYAKPEDIFSIRASVDKAYSSDRTVELKEHILKNFTWEKVAEKTAEAYRRVIGK